MLFILNHGLRAGGGIGEKMSEHQYEVAETFSFEIYAFLFFIVFPFFLMNIMEHSHPVTVTLLPLPLLTTRTQMYPRHAHGRIADPSWSH